MVFETHQGGQSGGNLRFSPKKPPLLLFCLKKIQQFQVSPAKGKTGKKDVFFFRTVSEPFLFPHSQLFLGQGPSLAPSDSQASWHVNFMRKERTERLPSIVEARVRDFGGWAPRTGPRIRG